MRVQLSVARDESTKYQSISIHDLFSEYFFESQGKKITLAPTNRIQIIGEPGAGKSTVGKTIVYQVTKINYGITASLRERYGFRLHH